MRKQRIEKFDRFIVAISFAVLSATGYLLFDDSLLYSSFSQRESLQKVAVVSKSINDVRRRIASDVAWLPINKSEHVFMGDSIFTSPSAEAEIRFDDGSIVNLDPGSLIVISREDENDLLSNLKSRPTLSLEKGSLLSSLTEKKSLFLKVKNKAFKIKSQKGKVRITKKSEGGPKIVVLEGNVEVTEEALNSVNKKSAPKQILKKNQSTEIDSEAKLGKVESFPIELLKPLNDEILIFSGVQKQMFEWNSSKEASNFVLEISRSPTFKSKVNSFESLNSKINIRKLPKFGNFYWRVRSQENELISGESPIHHFKVITLESPQLIEPIDSAELEIRPTDSRSTASVKTRTAQLFWSPVNRIKDFEIQISKDRTFSSVVQSSKTNKTVFKTQPLERGEYFWRVRSGYDGKYSKWSPTENFAVIMKTFDVIPQILTPISPYEINLPGPTANPLALIWKPIKNVKGYVVEIATSPDFNPDSIVQLRKVRSPRLKWKPKKEGQYYWRVKAVNKEGSASPYSEQQKIKINKPIRLPAPKIDESTFEFEVYNIDKNLNYYIARLLSEILPIAHAKSIFYKDRDSSTTEIKRKSPVLKWSEVESAREYIIEIARDKSFSRIVKKGKTNGTEFNWEDFRPGKYYWRVKAISNDNRIGESSTAMPLIIKISPRKLEKPKDTKFTFNSVNDFEAAKASIDLKWEASEHTKYYLLEIKSEKYKKSFKRKVQGNSYRVSLPKFGTYLWRVKAITKRGRSLGRFSKWLPFDIEKELIIPPPIEGFPADTSLAIYNNSDPISVQWKPGAEGPYKFRVEFSDTQNFDTIIESNITESNSFKTSFSPEKGELFWRVRAIYKQSRSEWSNYPLYIVKRDRLLEPPNIIQIKRPFFVWDKLATLDLNWIGSRNSPSYVLEFRKDLDNNPFQTVYTKHENEVISLQKGEYYWQVTSAEQLPRGIAAITDGAIKVGKPSQIGIIKIRRAETFSVAFDLGISSTTLNQTLTGTSTQILDGSTNTSSSNQFGVGGEYWPSEGNWGLGGFARFLSGSGTFTSTTSITDPTSKVSLFNGTILGKGRVHLGSSMTLIGGLGIGFFPQYGFIDLGTTMELKTVAPFSLAQELSLRFEPDFGKYSIRTNLLLTEKLSNLSGSLSLAPSFEFRYLLGSFFVGLEYFTRSLDYTAPASDINAADTGSVNLTNKNSGFFFKIGIVE